MKNETPSSGRKSTSSSGKLPEEQMSTPAVASHSSHDEDYSRIVANLTHELKTPLHSILAVASLLASEADGLLNTEQKKQVQIITRNGEQLLELITELLQFSSTATKTRKLNIRRLNPQELFQEIQKALDPVAARSSVEIQSDYSNVKTEFCSDKTLLRRIVANLLSNAVKFSPKGGSILFFAESLSDDSLRLQIADSGIGMQPEVQQAIFKEFFQADAGDSRRFGGVGLGLALVKKSLDLLHGRIEVRSEPGKGSVFTLFVPSAKDTLEKPKIAIVEQDENVALSLGECFVSQGYDSYVVSNEHELPTSIAEQQPDLVMLDVRAPGYSGFLLLEQLRNSSWGKTIPVILMSTLDGPEERAHGFKLGASDFIVKPFNLEELLARVRRLLEQPW